MELLQNRLHHLLRNASLLVESAKEEHHSNNNNQMMDIEQRLILRLENYDKFAKKDNLIEIDSTNFNTEITRESSQTEKQSIAKTNMQRSVKTEFVSKCLNTLTHLQNTLQDINDLKGSDNGDARELLGVRDLRLVYTMLEIVTSWGIYPLLMPGVGIPISQRSRSGFMQNDLFNDLKTENQQEYGENVSTIPQLLLVKYNQLFHLMRTLSKIALSPQSANTCIYTTVSSIIFTRYLTDMYAGLLQLAYGPIPTNLSNHIENQQITGNLVRVLDDSTQDCKFHPFMDVFDSKIREESLAQFRQVFERANVYRSLESLMMLLGASPLHPVPNWLKSVCGQLLTYRLLQPGGVQQVIDYMIGGETQVSLSKLESISRLLLSVPNQIGSPEEYFSKLCPQLLSILQSTRDSSVTSSDANIGKLEKSPSIQVAAFTIVRLNAKDPSLTRKLVVDKLFKNLCKWWSGLDEDKYSDIIDQQFSPGDRDDEIVSLKISNLSMDPTVIDEITLQSTITVVHRVLVGSEPSPDLLQNFLEDAIAPLYHFYSLSIVSKSYLREPVFDILLAYFRIVTNSDGVEALKEIVFRKSKRHPIEPREIGEVGEIYFAPGPSGGIVMRVRSTKQQVSEPTTSIDVYRFIEFMKTLTDNELTGEFFMYLLNEYTAVKASIDPTNDSKRVLTVIHLVLEMTETFGSSILQKPGQVIAFVNNFLENYQARPNSAKAQKERRAKFGLSALGNIVEEKESFDESDENQKDDNETLLWSSVEHQTLSKQDMHILNLVFANLDKCAKHNSTEIRQMAHDLRIMISVRNAAQASSGIQHAHKSQREESIGKYQEAMEALQDDILPVRARGLVILKEMILAKDPFINEGDNIGKILDIFVQMVRDEESFIYLTAVRGLSSLSDVYGEIIMQKLMELYNNPNENVDHRLRIGEAILQTIQRCGEALGKYIATLLPPLFHVLDKETNSHLRVSALSIIGTACETSPFALSMWFEDVVGWTLNIINIEKIVEIRRASIVLFISLFRALAVETLHQIPGDFLKRAYRTLRYVEETDQDDLTRHYSRVARSDLDVIVRNAMSVDNNENSVSNDSTGSILFLERK
ncbi:hypothetical protein G9A89_018464 [Geosiphon pyriformis]|nr:hypothetical protein G9A89_018464 [Geosiphon pyriformis]